MLNLKLSGFSDGLQLFFGEPASLPRRRRADPTEVFAEVRLNELVAIPLNFFYFPIDTGKIS